MSKGDVVIEFSLKYEHEQAAGVQRVVALVFEQKEKIDTSSMTRFNKVRKVPPVLMRDNQLII